VTGFGGRRALVTGGASGIGYATASLLSELGAEVVLLDLDADAARRAAERLGAQAVTADVRRPEEVEGAVADATRSLAGQSDLLVNAAGIYRFRPALDIDVAEWDDVLDTNLRGPFFLTQAVAGAMVELPHLPFERLHSLTVPQRVFAGKEEPVKFALRPGGVSYDARTPSLSFK